MTTQKDIHLRVLKVRPVKGRSLFKKEINVFTDENGLETHKVFIKSFAYKLVYLTNNDLLFTGQTCKTFK